jgi:hypothetical protein
MVVHGTVRGGTCSARSGKVGRHMTQVPNVKTAMIGEFEHSLSRRVPMRMVGNAPGPASHDPGIG